MYDKKILTCLLRLCFIAPLICCLTAGSASAALNVRDFGAKGDNVTDDTKAIRAAFGEAQRLYHLTTPPGGGNMFPVRPEVLFPDGRYRISDSIYVGMGIIRGEGEAAIIQTNSDKDIFTTNWAWRLTISGLTFVGGRNQLQLSNPNSDKGLVLIDQCRFYYAAGVAIMMDKPSYSTQLKIRDCVFVEPEQALISYADETNMTDCWITSSRKMKNKAVIEARGARLVLEKILGVPLVNGTDQRWIDNHSTNRLTCRDFRFGGEGGGFTPVVNFTKYFPSALSCGNGPHILLENCDVYARANKKRRCTVYLEEIPNGITIRNCRLSVPALKFSEHIDLKTYFKGTTPGLLNFAFENNLGTKDSIKLPDLLKHPVIEGKRVIAAISPAQTTRALAGAQVKVRKLAESPSASGLSFGEHKQQNQQGKFVEIGYSPTKWRLDSYNDYTGEKNSEHLAVRPIGNDVIIMRRTSARAGLFRWPHVLIKDVIIDLDKYPYLSWKLRGAGMPSSYAVKVLEKESGVMRTLIEGGKPWTEYRAYNLKKLFKMTGVRKFDIKFYYLGENWQTHHLQAIQLRPADYILVDFIRTESE